MAQRMLILKQSRLQRSGFAVVRIQHHNLCRTGEGKNEIQANSYSDFGSIGSVCRRRNLACLRSDDGKRVGELDVFVAWYDSERCGSGGVGGL